MIKAVLLQTAVSIGSALLTDKFIINMLVVLLERVTSRTKNTWDDELLKAFKEALDQKKPQSTNLYNEVKSRKVK